MKLRLSLGDDDVVTGAAFNADNVVVHVDLGSAASLARLQAHAYTTHSLRALLMPKATHRDHNAYGKSCQGVSPVAYIAFV